MSAHEPHPAYQETGLNWLGPIPLSWSLRRLGSYFDERRTKVSDNDFPALSVTMQGVVPQLETAAKTDDGDNRKLVRKGDFAINSRSDRKGSSGVSPLDGSVSLITIVLEPKGLHSRFVHHLFRSRAFQEEFYRFGKGIVADLWSTSYASMKNIEIPIMSLTEQAQIARFLDYETARIDALIEKQQQLIGLLKEKRQAVISHAVTKGLNPDAPLRDSGVEWLGMVPVHWKVTQLRHWIEAMEQGRSPECESREANFSEWGVLKTGCVNGGVFHPSENKALPTYVRPFPQYEVKPFDVLMSRASGSPELIGSVAFVTEVRRGLLLSDKIFRVSLSKSVAPLFFTYLMRSSAMRTLIVRSISGAEGMANNITKAAILSFGAPMPPFQEQASIVEHIQKATSRLEQLIDSAGVMLSVLSERRTALISAAVTGKIDVRGWKPPESNAEQDVA